MQLLKRTGIMTGFIGIPLVIALILGMLLLIGPFSEPLKVPYLQKIWALLATLPHRGASGVIMGFGLGLVFLLAAAFSYNDKCWGKEGKAENAFSMFWEWVCSCTGFMILIMLSGWYLCAIPPLVKEGMVFTHPQILGEIYSTANNEPLMHTMYKDEDLTKFEKRVETISSGIFIYCNDKNAGGQDCSKGAETLLAAIMGGPFFIAFGFSTVGAIIYALMDSLEKVKGHGALLPRNYLSYMLRSIMAPFVAIVIAFYLTSDWPVYAAPAILFMIGLFPKRGVEFITAKSNSFLQKTSKQGTTEKEDGQ